MLRVIRTDYHADGISYHTGSSCSYRVFGMTYHLNSALFLYLHHLHCKSQNIIFVCLPPPGPHSKLKSVTSIFSKTLPLTRLIFFLSSLDSTTKLHPP